MSVLSEGDAGVIAAIIAAVGAVIVAVMGKVHRDNRSDHRDVARRLDRLHVTVEGVADDVRDVKADVRDLKQTDRDHEGRLGQLEHPPRRD